MKRLSILLVISIAIASFAQSSQQPSPDVSARADSPGLALLKQTAQHYADAKSYLIQAVQEWKTTSEYEQSTQKTLLTAAEAPGGRYHYEGRNLFGGSTKIADGSKVWSYRLFSHTYTVQPLPADKTAAGEATSPETSKPEQPVIVDISENARFQAEVLKKRLAQMADTFLSAQILPDETVTLDGRAVLCRVLLVKSSDEKRVQGNYEFNRKIFIDKARNVVLETVEQGRYSTRDKDQSEQVTTIRYTVTELDAPLPDHLFVFMPSQGDVQVTEFPDPRDNNWGTNRTGLPVPALQFKDKDGKVIPIESLRGKPVLIDVWATWCPPCVALLPELARIYHDTKDKGLALVSVDQDEEAAKAQELWAKRGYTWPEYHDGDGTIEKLIGANGIPHVVLVNAQGKIVFDAVTPSEDKLRTEIAKLGPEFASVAPKPAASPCVASK